jgi:uncharacterized membrane protein
MKSIVLPLHLTFVGLWLGCVLTEALFERALLGKGREQEMLLAALHKRVDVFVEIPAFVVVLLTGGLMLPTALQSPALTTKIGFGLLAVVANIYCVRLVFRRLSHGACGDWAAFHRVDHLQHKIGAIVLVGILIALGIGLFLFAHR